MNTKKAIELMVIEQGGCSTNRMKEYYSEVIDLLKRGEKFEQMWRELTDCAYGYRDISNNYTHLVDLMERLKQKYFPKPKRYKRINEILDQLNSPGIQTDVRELKNLLIELRDEEEQSFKENKKEAERIEGMYKGPEE
ncbi:MAG: hypothetical protein E3J83_04275 [Candidatus Atribacteria bacterium]|nr:MAG: hypothetical protein E3J83_04275 [Candidatus Atribacteria bacterium]